MGEILHLLDATGQLQDAERKARWDIGLPQGVREAVRQRLARLSTACLRLLAIAAVIGEEFALDIVQRVEAVHALPDPPPLLELFDEALSARLLIPVPYSLGRYRFSYSLVRETLYNDLSLPERTLLHRQIGEAIEARHAGDLTLYLTQLADHFLQAAPDGDRGKALRYAVRAGEQAMTLFAYEEAADQYQRALQIIEPRESTAAQRCELLLALGKAQAKAGEAAVAKDTALHAAALARQWFIRGGGQSAASLLARAALGFGGMWANVGVGSVDESLLALLEEALNALAATDSELRARVLARLAAELRWLDQQRERRIALSQQAVAMARRLDDHATFAYVLAARHWALWGPDNVAERLATANELISLAEAACNKEMALVSRTWRLAALLELGDITAVDREITIVTRLAAELRQTLYLWLTMTFPVMRALLAGHFAAAEQRAEQAFLMGQKARAQDAWQVFSAQMATLRSDQGRPQELAQGLQVFAEQYPAVPAWQGVLAYLHSELGQAEDARGAFNRLAAHDFTDLPRDQYWFTTIVLLVDVCVYLGDTRCAAQLYDLLRP